VKGNLITIFLTRSQPLCLHHTLKMISLCISTSFFWLFLKTSGSKCWQNQVLMAEHQWLGCVGAKIMSHVKAEKIHTDLKMLCISWTTEIKMFMGYAGGGGPCQKLHIQLAHPQWQSHDMLGLLILQQALHVDKWLNSLMHCRFQNLMCGHWFDPHQYFFFQYFLLCGLTDV
jgi:hypothetical protein